MDRGKLIESTSGPDIVNNELIMETLMGYVGKADLLNSRVVSKRWNKEVVHFLTRNSTSHYLVGLKKYDLHRVSNAGPKTLDYFHILLENSQHPELLIQTLKLDSYIVENFNSLSMNNVKCEQILRVFGHHVKRLIIEDDKSFNVLGKCLGRYGYCLNLLELELTIGEECNEEIPFLMEPFVRHVQGLQLRKLQFNYATKKATSGFLKVFQGLLDNSPHIEHLFIKGGSEGQTHRFLETLQGKPEIVRKLREFQLKGNILDNFPTLCRIQFGSNLKRVYLKDNNFSETQTPQDEQVKGLTKFLRMVSPTLETLYLFLWYGTIYDTATADISSLPRMPKLVKLHYPNPEHCKKFIWHFLKKSPSLRTLDVNEQFIDDCDYQGVLKSCWEEEKHLDGFTEDVVPRLIHKRLERIEVGYRHIASPTIIQHLNVAFPNLSNLNFCPDFGSGDSAKGHQDWFESAFLCVSQMKQLKDLEVDLSHWRLDQFIVDLKGAFSNLKDTPNLVKVTMVGLHKNGVRARSIFNSLVALTGAPKLRRIHLSILTIFKCSLRRYLGEEMDWDQLIAELVQSNIHLEVQNYF